MEVQRLLRLWNQLVAQHPDPPVDLLRDQNLELPVGQYLDPHQGQLRVQYLDPTSPYSCRIEEKLVSKVRKGTKVCGDKDNMIDIDEDDSSIQITDQSEDGDEVVTFRIVQNFYNGVV